MGGNYNRPSFVCFDWANKVSTFSIALSSFNYETLVILLYLKSESKFWKLFWWSLYILENYFFFMIRYIRQQLSDQDIWIIANIFQKIILLPASIHIFKPSIEIYGYCAINTVNSCVFPKLISSKNLQQFCNEWRYDAKRKLYSTFNDNRVEYLLHHILLSLIFNGQ